MSATVHNIRPEAGPPATDFEREAVSALLERIREFRADKGQDPDGLFYVLLGRTSGGAGLGWQVSWFDESPDSTTCRMAMAGALMTSRATAVD